MEFSEFFVIFIVILIILSYIKGQYEEVEYVRSKTDGRMYLVRNLPDKQKAADLLGNLSKDLQQVVDHVHVKNDKDRESLKNLKENFNPDNISESASNDGRYTSYSVNKGEKLVICLRKRDGTNQLVDKNTLLYVTIHELAHIMTKSVGHTKEFWDNFKYLLEEAIKIGVYQPIDYQHNPKQYCGIVINNSIVHN